MIHIFIKYLFIIIIFFYFNQNFVFKSHIFQQLNSVASFYCSKRNRAEAVCENAGDDDFCLESHSPMNKVLIYLIINELKNVGKEREWDRRFQKIFPKKNNRPPKVVF